MPNMHLNSSIDAVGIQIDHVNDRQLIHNDLIKLINIMTLMNFLNFYDMCSTIIIFKSFPDALMSCTQLIYSQVSVRVLFPMLLSTCKRWNDYVEIAHDQVSENDMYL